MIKRISQSFTYWYLFLISYPTLHNEIINAEDPDPFYLGYFCDFTIYSIFLLLIFLFLIIDKFRKPLKNAILEKIFLIFFYITLIGTVFIFYKWIALILFLITSKLGFPIELNVTFLKPVFFWIKTLLSL